MRILVVEDEEQLCIGLCELLRGKGYQVETAKNIQEAEEKRRKAKKENVPFQLYLLDVMLERESGFTLCQLIRKNENTPIIFLTAMDDEESVVHGLELGGDDYVTKPFRSRELLSRIQANLRRYRVEPHKEHENLENAFDCDRKKLYYRSGEIVFAVGEERVYLQEKELSLRKMELELLKYFMQNNGILLRRERILEKMWDSVGDFVEDNTLSVQISRLRQRIGKYNGENYIETIRGMGYRWCQPVERI